LILNGWSGLSLGQSRTVRHARWVALKLAPAPLCWLAILLGLMQCALGRMAWPRIVSCNGANYGMTLMAFRVRRPRPHTGVRRFIPHQLGGEGFLRRLNSLDCRIVVLRWFETLPQLPPGEDLDLLVEDAKLEDVRAILDEGPGIAPVDLYSVTGLPGSDFRSMPYFPPYLAEQLLDRANSHRGLCKVPAPREHFLSLAYHALYHKGLKSGIPRRGPKKLRRARADHDYQAILSQLADSLGIDVPITLEDLDAYLDLQGWRPPHDMLIRLARRNRWVRTLLQRPEEHEDADHRLAVFLIRQEALHRGGVERAAGLIKQHGFGILATRMFECNSLAQIARSVRGGNWGRGPWPISGGPPVAAIVVFDTSPITPTRKQRRRFPFLANARLLCKEQIRDAFNEGLPPEQHCNVIHSSDNGREAMDYLRIIMPEAIAGLLKSVELATLARAA
jgi:hypothetical protein